jgi:hypothetical protein
MGAAVFATWVIVRLKRKLSCKIAFGLVSLFTTVLGGLSLVERHQDDQVDAVAIMELIILGLLRMTLNAVWGIFFVFIAELYPSEVTSVSFGWINIVGTVGATIAPFIRLTTTELTFFFMGAFNLINFFLIG